MSQKHLEEASELLDEALLNAVRKMKEGKIPYNAAIMREARQRLKDLNIGASPGTNETDEQLAAACGFENDPHVIPFGKLPPVDKTVDDPATQAG